jgi:hypothetical protein
MEGSIKTIWHYGGKLLRLGPYTGHNIIGTPALNNYVPFLTGPLRKEPL